MKNPFCEIHRGFLLQPLGSVVMIFFVTIEIIVVFVTTVFALLLTTTPIRFMTFFAAFPDRVGYYIKASNRMVRVVTVDY